MATIKDVAERAGVAVSTVSKYINGGSVRPENVSAIGRAIAQLDFRVNPFARSLKTQRSRSVGVLLPDMRAPFFGAVSTALDKALRERGYHIILSCYNSNHGLERDNLQFLISNGIDGLIYFPEDLSAEEFYELTAHRNVPVVQVDRMIPGVDSDMVLVDNADVVQQTVAGLIREGHRRIGLIAGPKSVYTAKERQVGYLKALSEQGVLYDGDLLIVGENIFATGYRGGKKLMTLEQPPTAILCTNYDITVGLITAARELCVRIPEDVTLVGFDCVDVCTMMEPPVPVILQPEQRIGQTAAAYLTERMEGCAEPSRMTRLQCHIIGNSNRPGADD